MNDEMANVVLVEVEPTEGILYKGYRCIVIGNGSITHKGLWEIKNRTFSPPVSYREAMLEDESTHVKLTQVLPSCDRNSSTTTTLVKYSKRRDNQFMNRPNVQNGLAGNITRANHSVGGENNNNSSRKPPFVTTVVRGKFLPSKFDLLLERTLYTFSSRPRPVGVSKHQCSLYSTRKSYNSQPRGVHDYFNLMWDPHVRRGNTGTGTRAPPQKDDVAEPKSVTQTETTSNAPSAAKGRKKRSSYTTRSSRYRIQRVSTPPPGKGRLQALVQTDAYLEYLTDDTHVAETDVTVQTDPIRDQLISPPLEPVRLKTGVDASTQVLPGELHNFDDEVQPVVGTLVAKILEQSLVEVMEEEELAAIREQQRRFEEKKKQEERQLRLLQEQHQRISAEKERLREHLESRHHSSIQEPVVSVNEESFQRESSAGGSGGPVYTTSDLLELLPSVLDSLRQEGFLSDGAGDDAFAQLNAVISSGSSNTVPRKEMKNNSSNPVQEPSPENGGSSPVELQRSIEEAGTAALEIILESLPESSSSEKSEK